MGLEVGYAIRKGCWIDGLLYSSGMLEFLAGLEIGLRRVDILEVWNGSGSNEVKEVLEFWNYDGLRVNLEFWN